MHEVQRFIYDPVISMWIQANLYLSCVGSRFSSNLKSIFLDSHYIDAEYDPSPNILGTTF